MKALITGASSGIGYEFAKRLDKEGYQLILVSKDEKKLKSVQEELGNKHKAIACDLSSFLNVADLYDKVKDENIDLLINNAGFGDIGYFVETDFNKELSMINTNVIALHLLTKLILKDMVSKNSGTILNVASSAAFQPGPLMTTYYATKAYVYNFTLGLYQELKEKNSNVKIHCLCPGPVDTNFNNVANCEFSIKSLTKEKVVDYTLKKMKKNKLTIIPGLSIRLVYIFGRFAPMKLKLKLAYKIQHKKIK